HMARHMQPGDLARICRPLDWFGLNHYSPTYAKADPASPLGFALTDPPPELPRSPIGWPSLPDAFSETLRAVDARYHLPIYVLENGMGGHDEPNAKGEIVDDQRIAYLR